MRIRGSSWKPTSSPSTSLSSSPPSLSSSALNSSPSIDQKTRCEGLDLLIKAVIHIAGSVVFDIPFTLKNAPMKGKRALEFKNDYIAKVQKEEEDKKVRNKKKFERIKVVSKPIRRKRLLSLPSKYQDSVLQPWKRQTRRRPSLEIDG